MVEVSVRKSLNDCVVVPRYNGFGGAEISSRVSLKYESTENFFFIFFFKGGVEGKRLSGVHC